MRSDRGVRLEVELKRQSQAHGLMPVPLPPEGQGSPPPVRDRWGPRAPGAPSEDAD